LAPAKGVIMGKAEELNVLVLSTNERHGRLLTDICNLRAKGARVTSSQMLAFDDALGEGLNNGDYDVVVAMVFDRFDYRIMGGDEIDRAAREKKIKGLVVVSTEFDEQEMINLVKERADFAEMLGVPLFHYTDLLKAVDRRANDG
jgi:hypothetical protein